MTDRYELRDKDEQLAALAAAVRHMQPSKKGGKTIGEQEVAEARHRERQTALHLQNSGEGQEDRRRREERLADRALARASAQSAEGAPPEQGSVAQMESFLAAMRHQPTVVAVAVGAQEVVVQVVDGVDTPDNTVPMEEAEEEAADAVEEAANAVEEAANVVEEALVGEDEDMPTGGLEVRAHACTCLASCRAHAHTYVCLSVRMPMHVPRWLRLMMGRLASIRCATSQVTL